LHAGAARKNDHHVFAKSFLVILNALAKAPRRQRPSPVMEMMPQAMPNIVSMVRRLCAHSVASVSRSKSWNDMALRPWIELLQNDLLLLVRPSRISVFTPFEMPASR